MAVSPHEAEDRNNTAKSQHRFLTQHTECGVAILTFTQPLLNTDAVAEAATVINASKILKVILDLQAVRSLVSGSLFPIQEPLSPLLNLRKQLANDGGLLILCNLAPAIDEVFRITALNQIFEILPDIDSAVACLTS
jgi:anti-anti-sigma factor